jgi:hypothetical protein
VAAWSLIIIATTLLAACAPEALPAPPRAAGEAPRARAEPAQPSEPEAGPGVPPAAISFEPATVAPPADPAPHVEILFPFAEQSIAVDRAARTKLRLKVEHFTPGADGAIELVLNDFRPRRLTSLERPPELAELVPENAALGPGQYTLAAIAVRADGSIVRPRKPGSLAPFAFVRFWIGERGAARGAPSAPRLVYLWPRGTFNGEAQARRVLLDFLPIGVELGPGKSSVVVHVAGEGASGSTKLESWTPLWLIGLPSGDHEIRLELVGLDGRPHGAPETRARGWITVNLDAPVAADGGA